VLRVKKEIVGTKTNQSIRHAEINTVERDTMVKDMEARIELIQDELDKFNTYTEI